MTRTSIYQVLTAVGVALGSLQLSFARAQEGPDWVRGHLVQVNDNGAWCWYQDERAVVDASAGKLLVGSVASGSGCGGPSRNGNVEAVVLDLTTRQATRYVLTRAGCDDHNAPAFLVRPDGKYLAMYAQHYDTASRYRIFDGASWSPERQFDWSGIPGGTDFSATYSNLHRLAAEGRVYNFVRCYGRSPNFMVSHNLGDTWSYGGLLTYPDVSIGYVNGYFKYWSNGVDRIDFVCTEHHPRDYNTSLYHGYIRRGQSFDSYGTLRDSTIFDKHAPRPADFTLVFAANTVVQGVVMSRCWNIDLQAYKDGTIAVLFKARMNDDPDSPSDDPEHAFLYARFDGRRWQAHYLCRAGKKLYSAEQDYTGLGALHPADPNIVFVSTPYDPRDDSFLGVHEIFRGTTHDSGRTWKWTPVTYHSTRDNLRPIVPAWDGGRTILLWMRGSYFSAQSFDAAIVALIEEEQGTAWPPMVYVDATPQNTRRADGAALDATGPSSAQGAADGRWHLRTGYGNGDTLLTSAELGGEDAPTLTTAVVLSQPGEYDIWVNFWGKPGADWRIKAGLSRDRLQVFRQMACQRVQPGWHSSELVLEEAGGLYLYQAYVGRVHVEAEDTLQVFVDDEAVPAGGSSRSGDRVRTWYDGVSFAAATSGTPVRASGRPQAQVAAGFRLYPSFPNPFNLATRLVFSLDRDGYVRLTVVDPEGRKVATLAEGRMSRGQYSWVWDADGFPSGVYIAVLEVDGSVRSTKMLLIR